MERSIRVVSKAGIWKNLVAKNLFRMFLQDVLYQKVDVLIWVERVGYCIMAH